MNIKLILAALISVFSTFSLQVMNEAAIEYAEVSTEEVNKYIAERGANLTMVGKSADFIQLPDGKTLIKGRVPYGTSGKWVKIEVRYNADGTPDTSFGPKGMRALEQKTKLP